MTNRGYKYRTELTTTVDVTILKAFNEYAAKGGRIKTQLIDAALRNLLEQYGKEIMPGPSGSK